MANYCRNRILYLEDGTIHCIWSLFRRYPNSIIADFHSILHAGLSAGDADFIKAAAVLIILFCSIRLVLEIGRFIRQLHIFFADFDAWVEVPLFIFAIMFVAVFDRECLCPRDWQWQVGIAAVFLVWIDLIIYMRRMRVLGK